MKITIHRGTHQIGGCITEIKSESGARIIIDMGAELPNRKKKKRIVNIKGVTSGEKNCDGVFITHYHGDHVGDYKNIIDGIPIYMGEAAKEIFLVWQKRLTKLPKDKRPVTESDLKRIDGFEVFEKCAAMDGNCKAIEIKKDGKVVMKVTPIRTDHSAFDSYMFLIEADNQKILHTGDFRKHGFMSDGDLPKLSDYAKNIDVLISESTILSRQSKDAKSEKEIREKAYELLRNPENKNVFVLCSSVNIDAMSTFYNAAIAIENKKMFIVLEENFQKEILKTVNKWSNGNENYEFNASEIRAYLRGDELAKDANIIDAMKNSEHGFCMIIGANSTSKEVIKKFKDHLFIYSLWGGYLEDRFSEIEDYKKYSDIVKETREFRSKEHVSLHTSGHATQEAIEEVIRDTNPKVIIPMHGEEPECFEEINTQKAEVKILNDRETYDVATKKIDEFSKADWNKRIRHVKAAKEFWEAYEHTDVREKFHLRPFSAGSMLICTDPSEKHAMTGVTFTAERRAKLHESLSLDNFEKLLKDLGFNARSDKHRYFEYMFQCRFINALNSDNDDDDKKRIEDKLQCTSLCFVASEFVIHKGFSKKDIVDVIAYCKDSKTLYMFELKVLKEDGTPYNSREGLIEQVKRYKRKYGKGGTRFDEMCAILKDYPNNSVPEIEDVVFYSVIAETDKDISDVEEWEVEAIDDEMM